MTTLAPRFDPANLQSYGVLLVLREDDLTVQCASANCEALLGVSVERLIGQPFSKVIGRVKAETLHAALQENSDLDRNPFSLRTGIAFLPCEFDAILHRHGGQVFIEMEPCTGPSFSTEASWLHKCQRILNQMRAAPSVEQIAQMLVDTIHDLTGMARVMLYRFDAEWNGAVCAERRQPQMKSLCGLVFPAGDIAQSVREYYATGQMRYIHDVDYQPVRLLPELPESLPAIDLRYAALRGSAPSNLARLRYFGARSALMLPLLTSERLWGGVVCHGDTVNLLPHALRRLCAMLTQTAGLLIADRTRAEEEAERQRLQQAGRSVFNAVSESKGHFEQALSVPATQTALLQALDATGAVYWNPHRKFCSGTVPAAALDQLIGWVQQTEPVTEDFFATDSIAALLPHWADSELASGMIAIPLAASWQSGIAWFRPEQRHYVVWGRLPDGPMPSPEVTPEQHALASWGQEVCGKSRPWSEAELEAAHQLAGLRAHAALKVIEENLRRSEDRYRRLSAQTSDWYWEQDAEHRLLHSSNEIWANYGFNQQAVVGLRRWEIGGVQYDAEIWAGHISTLNQHLPFRDFEYAIKLPDGELHWASITGEPVFDKQGNFTGYLGTGTDITQRKQAELAVAESEARFRLLADNAPVLIWLTDETGARTYLNQTWLNFTGMPLSSQLGYGWLQCVHAEDLAHVERAVERGLCERKGLRQEYRLRHHDGSYRWIECTAQPRFSSDRRFLGFIGSITDIHERKRLELELTALNQTLEDRVQERTGELEAFAYTISHDLRAPLRAIDGYAALLTEETGDALEDDGKRYLQRVRRSAQHMAELIDALLHFSRYSLRPVERRLTSMNSLIREVTRELVPSGWSGNLTIKPLPDCDADTALMRQVWVNLLSNALKFTSMQQAPRIEIGFAGQAYYVADNGAGFDMQYVNKLFGVFNRLHTEREFEGTGAGLAIVRRIVERHGGKIWAQGEVNAGATFFFTITPARHPELLDRIL